MIFTKSQHYQFGKLGEQLAVQYLKEKGYTILDVNFRNKIGEIDIVAMKDYLLVVVEVKSRQSKEFGSPREAVSYHKQRQIIRVAQSYIQYKRLSQYQIRFDVIEIIAKEINHIEDAFRVA